MADRPRSGRGSRFKERGPGRLHAGTPAAPRHRDGGGRHFALARWGRRAAGIAAVAGIVVGVGVGLLISTSAGTPRQHATAPTTLDAVRPVVLPTPRQVATATVAPAAPRTPSSTLEIASLGVDAPILAEGIDTTPADRGNLAIPTNVRQTAWWDGGPQPGQPGVAVIAGHRSSAAQGDGALWTLPDIQVGAAITVSLPDGTITQWKTVAVQQVIKDQLPATLWSASGPPMLAVVTCGGDFDRSIGHYVDNVIVWAAPA